MAKPLSTETLSSLSVSTSDTVEKPVRNTVILREVSPNATESDVVSLFSDLSVKEVRKDMGVS